MIRIVISAILVIASLILFITGIHPVAGVASAILGIILAGWKFVEMEENFELS